MTVVALESSAPEESIALVKAAAEFISYRSMPKDTRDKLMVELLFGLRAFWPKLDTHEGGTHFRIFLDGKRDGADSVYVEWGEGV